MGTTARHLAVPGCCASGGSGSLTILAIKKVRIGDSEADALAGHNPPEIVLISLTPNQFDDYQHRAGANGVNFDAKIISISVIIVVGSRLNANQGKCRRHHNENDAARFSVRALRGGLPHRMRGDSGRTNPASGTGVDESAEEQRLVSTEILHLAFHGGADDWHHLHELCNDRCAGDLSPDVR